MDDTQSPKYTRKPSKPMIQTSRPSLGDTGTIKDILENIEKVNYYVLDRDMFSELSKNFAGQTSQERSPLENKAR